ncbi:MAG: ATP-dependent DNA ligase [Rhodospirillaceae bacterium]|nr:ATP-dependent DNA ligase [Rhodospirillaceae bacterium]
MSDVFARLDPDARQLLSPSAQPDWVAPMLATLTDRRFSDPGWIFERKLDGERALGFVRGGKARLMSRNRKDIGSGYPELIDGLEASARADCIVDGEIVAFEGAVTSFARLQRRMQIHDPDEARATGVAVFYYLFDILYLDGCSVDALPLRARKSLLRDAVDYRDPIRFSAHRNTDGEAYYAEACEKGWEGIIAKRADAPYRHSRSTDWLKFKCQHGQELVIGGFTEPHGSRKGFGALLVGYYEDGALRYAGKVGTGYDDETLQSMRRRLDGLARKTSPFADEVREKAVTWVSPELVGAFGFTEWTGDGKLRHPRFLGLRRDKAATDVRRETPGA